MLHHSINTASIFEWEGQCYRDLPRCVFLIFLCSLEKSLVPKQVSLLPCQRHASILHVLLFQEAASLSCVCEMGSVLCCAPKAKVLPMRVSAESNLTNFMPDVPLWLQACQFLSQKVSGLHAGLFFCMQEDDVWREFALCGDCSWTAPTYNMSKIGILGAFKNFELFWRLDLRKKLLCLC